MLKLGSNDRFLELNISLPNTSKSLLVGVGFGIRRYYVEISRSSRIDNIVYSPSAGVALLGIDSFVYPGFDTPISLALFNSSGVNFWAKTVTPKPRTQKIP